MYCLHCGDCCLQMCPISEGECPNLVKKDTFYFCGIYSHRPDRCANHTFPFAVCPVGMSKLGLRYPKDADKIRERIDAGYSIIREGIYR